MCQFYQICLDTPRLITRSTDLRLLFSNVNAVLSNVSYEIILIFFAGSFLLVNIIQLRILKTTCVYPEIMSLLVIFKADKIPRRCHYRIGENQHQSCLQNEPISLKRNKAKSCLTNRSIIYLTKVKSQPTKESDLIFGLEIRSKLVKESELIYS